VIHGGRRLVIALAMTATALLGAAPAATADEDREAVTNYDQMRAGAPHHGYFDVAWQPFVAQSRIVTHVGVTVGTPTLPAGSPVGFSVHVRLCADQPDAAGNCHSLADASPQIVNYGNSYVDLGDVAVIKGTTYWLVWFQPPAANGASWVTYWFEGGTTITTSATMQALVKGYDPAPATPTTPASPPAIAPAPPSGGGGATGPQRFAVANSTIAVNLRRGPGTSFPVVGSAAPGSSLDISCQTRGSVVFGSSVWDQLTSGAFISDFYTSTPGFDAFSPSLAECAAGAGGAAGPPASVRHRIANATIPVTLRAAPSITAQSVGTAAPGSPLDIVCQTVGDDVNGSRIWDRLLSGAYVSDYWTSTPVFAGYSPGIPLCDGAPDTVAPPISGSSTPWHVTARIGVTQRRNAPRVDAPSAGTLPYGTPLTVECQTAGEDVGGSVIWDRLPGNLFVSDYWVDTPVYGAYTASLPRCPGAPDVTGPPAPGGADGPAGGGPWGMASLGDSYSSGEGAPDDHDVFSENDACHRSHIAWPVQLADRLGVTMRMFVACSGATTDALFGSYRQQTPQLESLRQVSNVRYVAMTIGGNDVGFAGIAERCIAVGTACQRLFGATVDDKIESVVGMLRQAYVNVLASARAADVYVVGYPRFFSSLPDKQTCAGLQVAERDWMNEEIDHMNDVIQATVRGVRDRRLHYVDVDTAFEGRGMCSRDPLMNSVVPQHYKYSFHPNRSGQGRLAEVIAPWIR
jgi:lysophospholipase L1-like esterase